MSQQQIVLNKHHHSQKDNPNPTLIENNKSKDLLSTMMPGINAMDLIGLSWIFANEIISSETVRRRKVS